MNTSDVVFFGFMAFMNTLFLTMIGRRIDRIIEIMEREKPGK